MLFIKNMWKCYLGVFIILPAKIMLDIAGYVFSEV